MSDDQAYVLGTEDAELERLRFQHTVWVEPMYALLERARFRAGHVLLDLGCGPGFTTLELAAVVGPTGRVIARDASARFLAHLRREVERRKLVQIEPSEGPVERLELAPGTLDGAYARWLLSWVPDAAAVVERVERALKPGGAIALQEYLDWAAMKLVPRSAVFDRAVEACMRSWKDGGATIDVGELVPGIARARGLVVEHFRPLARSGAVGSLEWRWLGDFFELYLPKVVERKLYGADELERFRAEWARRAADGASWVQTPTLVEVLLRKP